MSSSSNDNPKNRFWGKSVQWPKTRRRATSKEFFPLCSLVVFYADNMLTFLLRFVSILFYNHKKPVSRKTDM
jgi:hypothetical protein